MGQVVITDRAEVELHLEVSGLQISDVVKLIESGEQSHQYRVVAENFSQREVIALPAGRESFVRFEVYDSRGNAKVFSNTISFVRKPKHGISAARAGIDVGAIVSRSIEGMTIKGFDLQQHGDNSVATLRGDAEGGRVELQWGAPGEPGRVDFFEMTGSWSFEDGVLSLDDLKGNGWLEITTIAE